MNTTIRELILAGAHFGHRIRFGNPKMAPYIYGTYQNTHIINLDYTLSALQKAAGFLKAIASDDGVVLFLGTKQTSSDIIEEEAKRTSMPYINQRWLGGMLTNFKTTCNSVTKLKELEESIASGTLKTLTKKEGLKLISKKERLIKSIGGVRDMKKVPDVLFVIDAGWHKGAITEAAKLNIPVVAVVDTNYSPIGIDYPIPGNDDSRQAVMIYARIMSDALLSGKEARIAALKSEIAAAEQDAKDETL